MTTRLVANYILYLSCVRFHNVTNTKLNYLLYLAQAYSLANHNMKIFPESIEVWSCGPMIPAIAQQYAYFSSGIIDIYDRGAIWGFPEQDREILEAVVGDFGAISEGRLLEMIREPNSEWAEVRDTQGQKIHIPDRVMVEAGLRLAKLAEKEAEKDGLPRKYAREAGAERLRVLG